MKQIFFLLTILVSSFGALNAQAPSKISDNVKKDLATLKKADLNLSDIQLTRITTVLIAEDQLLQKNLEVLKDNPPLLDVRLKELKNHKISNIQGAMTEQQVEKFKAIKLEEKL